MVDSITLYRPVGTTELELIEQSNYSAFPPRLPEQPIFYPVLNLEYASQIARDWNAKYNEDKVGYVTRFKVLKQFLDRYEIKIVGGGIHREYWIPAEELADLNESLVGKIEVILKFDGHSEEI